MAAFSSVFALYAKVLKLFENTSYLHLMVVVFEQFFLKYCDKPKSQTFSINSEG